MSHGVESVSIESGDFILVPDMEKDNSQFHSQFSYSQLTSETMNLAGMNQDEINLVKKIKRLLLENESVKGSLMKHNELLQEYCNELEQLKTNQKIEKEATNSLMNNLKKENEKLKAVIAGCSGNSGERILCSLDPSTLPQLLPKIDDVVNKLKMFEKVQEATAGNKSLPFPVQETQIVYESIKCLSNKLGKLQISHMDQSLTDDEFSKQIQNRDALINDLKANVSGTMEENETLNDTLSKMKDKLNEIQEQNVKLTNNNETWKKVVQKLRMKVEQMECEQPSVEIMQIASPQQKKMIETLTTELERANLDIKQLSDGKLCCEKTIADMNELKSKMARDASLQSKAEGLEINEMRNSYETAIKGLKEEIANEKQKGCKLLEEMKENESTSPASSEENSGLKKTIGMMRKRENKDLDKINELTSEKTNLKKHCEELDLKLNQQNQALEKKDSTEQGVAIKMQVQNEVNDTTDYEKKLKSLQNTLISHAQTIAIVTEENQVLKIRLEKDLQQSAASNDVLEANKDLPVLKRKLEEERVRCENLATDIVTLANETATLKVKLEEHQQLGRDDAGMLSHLKKVLASNQEEIVQYKQALRNYRQRHEILEASESKSRRDFDSLWQNFQAKVTQISQVEEQRKILAFSYKEIEEQLKLKDEEMKKFHGQLDTIALQREQAQMVLRQTNKLEEVLKAEMEDISKLEQLLTSRDLEINKLQNDVETMPLLREQMKIYESDFKSEREAREKQHSDILLLRDELHHYQLQNNRLKDEVEAANIHHMAELTQRYGVGSSYSPASGNQDRRGLYGRGAIVRDTRRSSDGAMSGGSFPRSADGTPQEPDQAVQRQCPKCMAPFPDLDTLQIHVLECLDE